MSGPTREIESSTKGSTAMRRLTVSALCAAIALTVAVPQAHAAFGDGYRALPINGDAATTTEVPALPGAQRFFWAGVCDRAGAPAPGSNLEPLGGRGTMPSTVAAPAGPAAPANIVDVPLLDGVRDCIDWRIGVGQTGAAGLDSHDIWDRCAGCDSAAPAWRLPEAVRAGGHPDGSATFGFVNDGDTDNIYVDLPPGFVGDPNAVPKCTAEQFAVKPQQCPPSSQVGVLTISHLGASLGGENFGPNQNVNALPVYNLQPRTGNVAELGLAAVTRDGRITVRLVAKARTNGDFGVTTFVGQLPGSALPVSQQAITLWGVPWAAHNDVWRAPEGIQGGTTGCNDQAGTNAEEVIPPGGFTEACRESYDPSWGPIRPFLSAETDCNQAPITRLSSDVYQVPGAFTSERDPVIPAYPWPRPASYDESTPWKTYTSVSPPVTDCASLGFGPDIGASPTTDVADAPAGLAVDLSLPQNRTAPFAPPGGASEGEVDAYVAAANAHWTGDAGRATAHLKDTVFTLPDGVSVNPSAATGLQGCSDAQIGLRELGNPPRFNNGDPFDKDGGADGAECPDGSKLGTVTVRTPLLDEPLTGELVLGSPKSTDPLSGDMFRLFIVVRLPERGLIAKVYGSTVADPATGQLTTTFANNPEIPFEALELDVQGGERGVLAMPQTCGSPGWRSIFKPWSAVGAATPVADSVDGGAFAVSQRCVNGFSPVQTAGMSTKRPRGFGTFAFDFSRQDGEQWLAGLTAKLPKGLLASVRGATLCTNAQANAGTCPLASQIGTVDATAGSGDPFALEEKGRVYLTEGYKGGPYGLAVKIRPIAGPFRGAMELSPIIIRQSIQVDRRSAQVTAISDPFPLIHHGVPLRARRVVVDIDRQRFMLNPSGCQARAIRGTYTGNRGANTDRLTPFQAEGCRTLRFKPRLKLRLTGRRQTTTGKHPGIRAVVRQRGIREAGIERAEVRLPKSLALDVNNAQALCEFADGTKPDLENHCPKGSIVGRARARTPLLNDPLVGNVYFVKNVRIDKDTGNEIRTLPMIVVALRGEIAVNLVGKSSTTKSGKLVNTFAGVPDAPVSRFNLNIRGGKNGILAVTRTRRARINLCAKGQRRQVAQAYMKGHNGKRHDRSIHMKTPCATRKRK
jgi:hypothetical protein